MSLSTLPSSWSVVLHTENYTCTTGGWLDFLLIEPGNAKLPPYTASAYSGYNEWVTSFLVDTVRTFSVGPEGLAVSDAQVTSRFMLTMSGPGQPTLSYDMTTAQAAANNTAWAAANPSLAILYPNGGVIDIPQLYPSGIYQADTYILSGVTYMKPSAVKIPIMVGGALVQESVFPTTLDPTNDLNAVSVDTGSTYVENGHTVCKFSPNRTIVQMSDGSPLDIQTTAGAIQCGDPAYGGANYILTTFHDDSGNAYSVMYQFNTGLEHFNLNMTSPSVPIGTLQCTSAPMGVFPTLPQMTVPANPSGALFTSATANPDSWGGFRYLKLTARVTGFATSAPLPRILLGLVPTSRLNTDLCEAALTGAPTYGIWYEVLVTEQGTTGQQLTIDLAAPISGSGTWWLTDKTQKTELPDPLGAGMFRINPCVPLPGNAWIADNSENYTVTTGPNGAVFGTLDTSTLVLAVDGSACVII